jgi:methylmalonyl-CoA mutase cobalamin-binding subunit
LWVASGVALLGAATASPAAEGPILLGILADTSGSIPKREFANRARIATEVARELPAGSRTALFSFDDEPRLLLSPTADAGELEKAAAELGARGHFTALNDAIFDAVKLLAETPAERRAILVISDGLDENSALMAEDGVQAARENGIPILAVGIGAVQERYLRRVAKLSGGEYFSPKTPVARIVERIKATTPPPAPAPRALAALPPAAAAAAGDATTAAQPAAVAAPSGLGRTVGLVLAFVLVAAAAALAFVYLRRTAAPSERPAAEAETSPSDEPTIIAKMDIAASPPTLVLTLKPLLHVTKGPDSGRFFEVGLVTPTSIGRADGNDVVLQDRAVSGQHCRIRAREQGGFEVIDLKSTNGTFVNEKRITQHKLNAGDVIKAGETFMTFRMDHLKT